MVRGVEEIAVNTDADYVAFRKREQSLRYATVKLNATYGYLQRLCVLMMEMPVGLTCFGVQVLEPDLTGGYTSALFN